MEQIPNEPEADQIPLDETPRKHYHDRIEIEENIKGREHVTLPKFYRTNRLKCQKHTSYGEESQVICPPHHTSNDSLSTEFLYYMGTIKELLPALSVYGDQMKVLHWLKKLFAPEYQASRLRLKRNKYLLHLILVMTTDTIFSIFQKPPSIGKLPEINQIQHNDNVSLARWEKDTYWDDLLRELRPDESEMKCSCHEICGENEEDGGTPHPIAGTLLDQEFRFFLYLAKPYLALIPNMEQRAVGAIWILTLAKVRTCACLTMKAIRNDYMQALIGYLQELRLVGPFNKMPPENGTTLKPLAEVAENKSVTDPSSEEAEDFMQQQPIPESGAFCYIAVTGNAGEPNKVSAVPLSPTKFENYFGK